MRSVSNRSDSTPLRAAVFGLGEAGNLIAGDLVIAGWLVGAYDPAPVDTPTGVQRFADPKEAVSNVDMVLALTTAEDAMTALEQAFHNIPSTALYADFSTASAQLKRSLAAKAAERGIDFVDVALLSVVVGKGIRAESLVSGTGAKRFVNLMCPLGMPVDAIDGEAGEAATRKLLRSVFMKGLAGVLMEAMRGAEVAGLSEWLWENLSSEIAEADEVLLRRLVVGTGPHAKRRLHEMEAAAELLSDLGVDPAMTRSTVANLQQVLQDGVPDIPATSESADAPRWAEQ